MSTHPDIITTPSEAAEVRSTTLGKYLRTTRLEQGLDISTVSQETRISMNNLQAIEEDEYSVLPADAFTRGFYKLYAKILALDPEDILNRYDDEKPDDPASTSSSQPVFVRRDLDVGVMAERYPSLPSSSIGMICFALLLFGAFLCWYFSWNPASFLSHKLRSLDQSPNHIEQVQTEHGLPDNFSRFFGFTGLRTATAADTPPHYNGNLQIIIVKSNQDIQEEKAGKTPSSPTAPTHQ